VDEREPLLHRLGATRAEAVAVAVLVAGVLACLGLVWTVAARRAVDAPAGAALGVVATAPAVAGPSATATPSAAPAPDLVVHVAGAVARPGVYRVAAGARIADTVQAAGGALPEAQLQGLNLARSVADGEQVLVPGPGVPPPAPAPAPAPAPSAGGQPAGLVDLNRATAADLDALPGVGPVLAARILEHRDRVGGFTRVDELADVKGIGDATFAELAPLVTV